MALEFTPIQNKTQIKQLAKIADEIWHEFWPSRIGRPQTDYMVERFQSYDALCRDILEKGYEYWFLMDKEQIVGYTGGHLEEETNRFFISKVYLYKDERGKGYSSQAIRFYEDLCRERKLNAMYLTVNKENENAQRAYKANGFKTIDETCLDIGDGFVMDDYIMEKAVATSSKLS